MNLNKRKRASKILIVLSCSLLVVITLITFYEQIPTILKSTKIYDKEYVSELRNVENFIPQNETLASSENYPQVAYFTDHKVKVPWMSSEKSLIQFMWKINSSYLLVPEDNLAPKPDNTPLLIQLAEKPFEKIFDYYYDYISDPKPKKTILELKKGQEKPFEKLFERVYDFETDNSTLHLYRLRSDITRDNLSTMTDNTKPILFVSFPVNGTIIESKFDVLRLNITGTAIDKESKIKKVEISVNGLVFQLAKPRAPDDWSTWSFSHIITSEGTKRVLVRATDNADNKEWFSVYITIK
jgi:hypothetical protein